MFDRVFLKIIRIAMLSIKKLLVIFITISPINMQLEAMHLFTNRIVQRSLATRMPVVQNANNSLFTRRTFSNELNNSEKLDTLVLRPHNQQGNNSTANSRWRKLLIGAALYSAGFATAIFGINEETEYKVRDFLEISNAKLRSFLNSKNS